MYISNPDYLPNRGQRNKKSIWSMFTGSLSSCLCTSYICVLVPLYVHFRKVRRLWYLASKYVHWYNFCEGQLANIYHFTNEYAFPPRNSISGIYLINILAYCKIKCTCLFIEALLLIAKKKNRASLMLNK